MPVALPVAPTCTRPSPDRELTEKQTRKRILVVDDDAAVLGSLQALLEILEADVETCTDPERALRLIEQGGFDLVISDERMPKVSGMEVLKSVRKQCPRTPTILITAYADPESVVRAYERCGVFGYVRKPWDNFELLVTIQEALRAADALS